MLKQANDYVVEGQALDYFEAKGEKYSYVVNLREEIKNYKIGQHIKDFYAKQPEGILFVKTTGGDEEQIQAMFKMLVQQLKVPEIHIGIPNEEQYTHLVAKAKELGTTIKFVNVYI